MYSGGWVWLLTHLACPPRQLALLPLLPPQLPGAASPPHLSHQKDNVVHIHLRGGGEEAREEMGRLN